LPGSFSSDGANRDCKMSLILRVQSGKDRAHSELKRAQLAGENQNIPHTGNGSPVNFRVLVFINVINPAHRFAEDLNIANDGVLQSVRGEHDIAAGG
jgi:hypothetical protein